MCVKGVWGGWVGAGRGADWDLKAVQLFVGVSPGLAAVLVGVVCWHLRGRRQLEHAAGAEGCIYGVPSQATQAAQTAGQEIAASRPSTPACRRRRRVPGRQHAHDDDDHRCLEATVLDWDMCLVCVLQCPASACCSCLPGGLSGWPAPPCDAHIPGLPLAAPPPPPPPCCPPNLAPPTPTPRPQ